MVLVELTRLRGAHSREDAGRIPAENRTVRHVCEARHRQRSRSHAVHEIVIGGCLRGDPGRPAMCMHIDRDEFAEDAESRSGGCRGFGGSRAARPHTAGEHRADRRQHRAPQPISARQPVATAVHVVAFRYTRADGITAMVRRFCRQSASPALSRSRAAWRRCRRGSRCGRRRSSPGSTGCGRPAPCSTGTDSRCRGSLVRHRSRLSGAASPRR